MVSDGAIYFGSYDHSLHCLDAGTGKERWHYATDGGIVSSPCVWNETLFFGSEDQIFYAVYTRTGRIVWTCPTDGKIRSSPQAEYGHVFADSPIEIVNIRLTGIGMMPKIAPPTVKASLREPHFDAGSIGDVAQAWGSGYAPLPSGSA